MLSKQETIATGLLTQLNLEYEGADRDLQGLSVAVKDLFHIQGYATSAGNPDWLRTHAIPEETSPAVDSLLKAGATLVGKALTDELAYSLNGVNIHYGTPINPGNPDRLPGGSSSGSVIAVASGHADIGLGTDTGGSIRVPSSYNGLFGMRPTHGVISTQAMVGLAPSFDTVGWMTRDLATLTRVAKVLYKTAKEPMQSSENLTTLKVIKPIIAGNAIWDDLCEQWLEPLKKQFQVEYIELEEAFYQQASEAFRILQGAEIWQTHGDWITQENPTFAHDIAERLQWCQTIDAQAQQNACVVQLEVQLRLLAENANDANAVFVLPTTPGPAPKLSATLEEMTAYRNSLMGLTALAGLSQRPQIHLPVLRKDEAPWGISLLGAKFQDQQLLQWADSLLSALNTKANP